MNARDPYNIYSQPDMPPFRSRRNDHIFRAGDPWTKKPQVVREAKVRVFDLADKEHLADFERVMALAGMSPPAAYLHTFEKHFCDTTGSWKAFVIWYELYSEMPDETRERQNAFLQGGACL
jgi:hypothetical protein